MTRTRAPFALIIAVMGLLSAFYHASNNALTQYFDFLGMSLMTSFLLANIAVRLSRRGNSLYTYYWFFMFLNGAAIMILNLANKPIQALLLFNAVRSVLAKSI